MTVSNNILQKVTIVLTSRLVAVEDSKSNCFSSNEPKETL